MTTMSGRHPTPPVRLYHATWPDNVGSIAEHGLQPGFGNCVHLANLPEYAALFLRLRGGHIIGIRTVTGPDGTSRQYPDIIPQPDIAVLEIDVASLDADHLHIGDDHTPSLFPPDLIAWTHHGPIPAAAITAITHYAHRLPHP